MNRFPDSNEWDAIVEDAFRSDAVHTFSDAYNARKEGIKKGIVMKRTANQRRLIAAVAAVAIIAAVPTTAYAYSKLHAEIQKTAPYENTITISVPDMEGTEIDTSCKALTYGYLPEGVELQGEDSPYEGKYKNAQDGGFTPEFMRIPDGKVLEERLIFSSSNESWQTEDKTIMISSRIEKADTDEIWFNREGWVYFEGTPYVARLYFTNDISDEDVKQTLEQLTLVPSDTETAGKWEKPESLAYSSTKNETYAIRKNIRREQINLLGMGETAEFSGYAVRLDAAWTQDDFTEIRNYAEEEYSGYLDADGTLAENLRTWYQRGDGISSLDEVVLTECVPQKVLVAEFTYTNTDSVQQEICICPSLFTLADDCAYFTNSIPREKANDYSDSMAHLKADSMAFAYDIEGDSSKNNVILAAGASAKVRLAFMVDAAMLENLYLTAGYSSVDTICEDGYAFDFCDVK